MIGVLLLLAAAEPTAAPGRVAILETVLGNGGSLFDLAFQSLSFRLGTVPLTKAELAAGGLGSALLACGGDRRCATERGTGIDRVLFLSANTSLSPILISIELFDLGREKSLAKWVGTADAGSLEPVVRVELGKVLDRAGLAHGGRLVVETVPPRATILLDGGAISPVPDAPMIFIAPPGPHQLEAEAEGFTSSRSEVVVLDQRDVGQTITLEQESWLSSKWVWIGAAAVAAIAGGAGVGFAIVNRKVEYNEAR